MTATVSEPVRLPLWRAILGFGVLGSLVAVLLALAPVYLQNYRLGLRVKAVVAGSSGATPGPAEDAMRQKLLAEARTFDLPVLPGDIRISRTADTMDVQVRYVVRKNLGLYQVDLHFHPSARTAVR